MGSHRKCSLRLATAILIGAAASLSACEARTERLEIEPPTLKKGEVYFDLLYFGKRKPAFSGDYAMKNVRVLVKPCTDVDNDDGMGWRVGAHEVVGLVDVPGRRELAIHIAAVVFCDHEYRQSVRVGEGWTFGPRDGERVDWQKACIVTEVRSAEGIHLRAATEPGELSRVGDICKAAMADPTGPPLRSVNGGMIGAPKHRRLRSDVRVEG